MNVIENGFYIGPYVAKSAANLKHVILPLHCIQCIVYIQANLPALNGITFDLIFPTYFPSYTYMEFKSNFLLKILNFCSTCRCVEIAIAIQKYLIWSAKKLFLLDEKFFFRTPCDFLWSQKFSKFSNCFLPFYLRNSLARNVLDFYFIADYSTWSGTKSKSGYGQTKNLRLRLNPRWRVKWK